MKEFLKNLYKSILAGIMISLGSGVFIQCTNKLFGAILFSFGLISILLLEFKLYTGMIGYIRKIKEIPTILTTIFGNFIGCLWILMNTPKCATAIAQSKMELNLLSVFLKAIICGIIIYICVECYKKKNSILVSLIGVPLFILSGAEHSIADMCYFLASGFFDIKMIPFILIALIGNAIGSLSISLLQNYFNIGIQKQ